MGTPKRHPCLPPRKAAVTPKAIGPMPMVYYHRSEFPIFAPVLGQMTVVHEPSLQLLQFSAHLTPLLGKAPRFCALLFGELAMLGSSLSESRKAVLGPRAGGSPSMELTAPHRESGGTLTWRTPARSGLAPLTLPVWAVKPWFGISFHCAQLSSVYGVLLYPILDGIARHARLGPRTAARAKLTNANCAQATLKRKRGCVTYMIR